MSDISIEAPPHPLGIAYHPDWQVVRDRWAERFCNAVAREAREAAAAARSTAMRHDMVWLAGVFVQGAVVVGWVGCFWWALS